MDARETDIRLAEKGAKEVDGNKESLTMKRVSENFVRLQTVTNEIMGAVKNDLTLEYLRVRDAAAEINKCAQRLKSDLVFPEAKGKRAKRDDSDDTDVKASLLQLNLDQIIELSNSIRKHSDKLSKTSLKP